MDLTRSSDFAPEVDELAEGVSAEFRERKRVARARLFELLGNLDSNNEEFEVLAVERTADRKGCRDTRRFDDANSAHPSPYQSDQKVLITLEIEVYDWDLPKDFIKEVTELEIMEDNVKAQVAIAESKKRIAAEQARIDQLTKNLRTIEA